MLLAKRYELEVELLDHLSDKDDIEGLHLLDDCEQHHLMIFKMLTDEIERLKEVIAELG